jgi:peptidoglycan/xylan/chitin deacetylase (PgdA/CDA1 family)
MIVPVLLYHSVTPSPTGDGSWGAVSRSQFDSHVGLLVASGRRSVTVSALAAAMRTQRAAAERLVVVTFDDGYRNTYDAIEVLRRRGLAATVYVTTEEIGRPDRLSSNQLRILARLPEVEVGSHGRRHQRLDELAAADVHDEVTTSKRQLEDVTSCPVGSFSYPHGAYDRRVRDAVIRARYRSAVSVKNELSHDADDSFAIARFTVTATTPARRIAELLEGVGVPVASGRERVRTRAYRAVRRSRRRLFEPRDGACR